MMRPLFPASFWPSGLLCALFFFALHIGLASFASAEGTSRPTTEATHSEQESPCNPRCRKGEFCFHHEFCLPIIRSCKEPKDCPGAAFCIEVGKEQARCLPSCDLRKNRSKDNPNNPGCWRGLGSCFSITEAKPHEGACYPYQYASQLSGEPCGDMAKMTQSAYHTCVEGLICHQEHNQKRCRPRCDPAQSKVPNKASSHPACTDKGALCIPLKGGRGVCSAVKVSAQKKAAPKKPLVQRFYKGVKEEVRFHLLDSESGIYWMYWLIHALIGSLFFLWMLNPLGSLSIKDALAYVFPARIYLTRQFFNDACVTVLNQTGPVALFLSLELYADTVGVFVKKGLFAVLGAPGFAIKGGLAALVFTVVLLLLSDLGAFLSHWMQHKIPVLWEFHKVHHSAETLNPLTNNRSHPIDLILISNVTGLLIGVAVGVAGYLSNSTLEESAITWLNAFVVTAPLILENFQHSHIPISFGRLDSVIMSPLMHQIHHSKAPEHLDKNLAQLFSFWDKMAGTLALPKEDETLSFGIEDEYNDDFNKLWVIYAMPFVRAVQCLRHQGAALLSRRNRTRREDDSG